MDTFYYSPGACSLAVHVALEEIGLPFEAICAFPEATHSPDAYRTVNPRGRVPALRTEGIVVTEVGALLSYLADRHPAAGLAPAPGTAARARFQEWLSWLASSVHVAFARIVTSERFTEDKAARASVVTLGRRSLRAAYAEIDTLLGDHSHALPEGYSAVDPYLMVFYRWGSRIGERMHEYRSYERLANTVAARPAAQRAMAREKITL